MNLIKEQTPEYWFDASFIDIKTSKSCLSCWYSDNNGSCTVPRNNTKCWEPLEGHISGNSVFVGYENN